MAQLADVPILAVGLIPEPDRVVGIEPRLTEGVRVEQPFACDVGAVGSLRPQGVEHDVVGVQ